MSAEKIVRPAAKQTTGYKGHRPGSAKEKLHRLFDKFNGDAEKARPLALKVAAASTVATSFSQFRRAGRKV